VREMIKNQWATLNKVRTSDTKIVNATNTTVVEGEEVLKDMKRSLLTYRNYITSIIATKENFIKAPLFDAICASMLTMSPQHLQQALEYMSTHYSKDAMVEKIVSEAMIHAFDVLRREKEGKIKNIDLSWFIIKLRGVYMSSRSTDPTLLALRDLTDKLCKVATKTKNVSALAAVRTGVLLYIVARAFSMKHYSS